MPSETAVSPLQRIGEFAALLRDHGFRVGVDEQRCMLRVAQQLGPAEPSAVESAWRAIACSDQRVWRRWQEVFERFWWPLRLRGQVRVSQQTRRSRDLRQAVQELREQLDSAAAGSRPPQTPDARGSADHAAADASTAPGRERAQGGASRTEALHEREHQMWLPQDLASLQRLAAEIAQRLRPRPTRRWRGASARAAARLDLRTTLRRSVAWGGEPLQAAWRVRRVEPPRLFILADVSRSMEAHGAFFLRVARAFA
ncbi:VWA domain-containing protein, partial [Metallibacterium scheffleri]|uniref:VWA domain-containing protein n=1 Tax=Metallibacterium scheffleri TaxID=993689 RepID=UPI0026F347F2